MLSCSKIWSGKLKQLLNNCFHSIPNPVGLQLPSLCYFHTTQLQSYISFIFGNNSLDPLQVHTADQYNLCSLAYLLLSCEMCYFLWPLISGVLNLASCPAGATPFWRHFQWWEKTEVSNNGKMMWNSQWLNGQLGWILTKWLWCTTVLLF